MPRDTATRAMYVKDRIMCSYTSLDSFIEGQGLGVHIRASCPYFENTTFSDRFDYNTSGII